MKLSHKILAGLAAALLLIQLVRPPDEVAAAPGPADLMVLHAPPDQVRRLLTVACYDCHSTQTRYPWYAEVEPVGWWLAEHVRDARAKMNFSTFGTLSPKQAAHLLDKCVDEINHGEMPLASYLLIHGDARMSAEDKTLLTAWFQAQGDQISSAGK